MTGHLADGRELEHYLRDLVRTAIADTGTRQTDLATTLGYTQKHISQLMRGHAQLRIDVAARMLDAMGWELVVAMRPRTLRNLAR